MQFHGKEGGECITYMRKGGAKKTTCHHLRIERARCTVHDGALYLVVYVEGIVGHIFLQVTLEIAPVDVARARKEVKEEGPPQQIILLHNSHQVALYLLIHLGDLVREQEERRRRDIVDGLIAYQSEQPHETTGELESTVSHVVGGVGPNSKGF